MAGVYSCQYVAIQGLDSTLVQACPAGVVVVIRDIDVYCAAALGGDFRFIGNNNQTIDYWSAEAGDAGHTHQWRGRQVFNPGNAFSVSTTVPMDVTVSGYLLQGVPPSP
jgi:hypothetical protein